ncbi:MAG: glycosyltransferase [Saccharofermentanales bacterium]
MYLCAKHPPYDGRIHYKISPTLLRKGYEVINVHPNIDNSFDERIKLVGYIQKKGFINRIKSFKLMYAIIIKQKPEIIIAPEPDSLVVAFFAKIINKNIKVIFDCHEWYNVHFTHIVKIKSVILGKILNGIITFIMKFAVKHIDAVITVNDTMTKYFKKYNDYSYTIPSIMSQRFCINENIIRQDYIYYGQFGNGGQEKILLGAAQILKMHKCDAKILVIGGYHQNEAEKYNEFISIIERENLQLNIQIEKWLPQSEAFQLLNSGLAGIMRFDTNYYNGLPALPNKIFEYMGTGMAVICCKNNVELKKIVTTERCGIIIEHESSNDLAEAIRYLHNNKDECLEMGKNALSATYKKYNWYNYGNILDKIINNTKEEKNEKIPNL